MARNFLNLATRTVRCGDVAAGSPVTLRFNESVSLATRVMREASVSDVIVIDAADRAIGILTARDVAVRVVAEQRDPRATMVGQVCSDPLATVRPDDEIDHAKRLMVTESISRLPVVGDCGQAVGVLSLTELALADQIGHSDFRDVIRTVHGAKSERPTDWPRRRSDDGPTSHGLLP